MADRVVPGPVDSSERIREAVCIHTRKIYSGCRDKDCIEDLRVFPTASSRPYIDTAFSIRPRSAELLSACVNVEEITFNRGYYTVDVTYFYRITGEAFPGDATVTGLAVFDKRVILFGSEGNAKIFSSAYREDGPDPQLLRRSNLPIAVAEAVDPIVLDARIADCCESHCCGENCCCQAELAEIPAFINNCFEGGLSTGGDGRRVYVTLGQFSIVRLERDSQLLIPVYDYCMPEKECCGGASEDPCGLFRNIAFPVNEFFPPNTIRKPETYEETKNCCCGS